MSSANGRKHDRHDNQSGASHPNRAEPTNLLHCSSSCSSVPNPQALPHPLNDSRFLHARKAGWKIEHDMDDLYSYQPVLPHPYPRSAPRPSSSSARGEEHSKVMPLRSRPGPGLLEMAHPQSQNSYHSKDGTKEASPAKTRSFLKTHHSEASTRQSTLSSTGSNVHPKHAKSSTKANKAPKHGPQSSTPPSASTPTGTASFNAIFRPQHQNSPFYDERIMLEEWLHKRSSSLQMVWKRRWCVLRDDCLLYYRSDTDTKPLGVLHLADYPVLSSGPDVSRKSKLAFRLSASEAIPREHQHHIFRTETPQALDMWLEALQGHIDHALSSLDGLGPLDLAANDSGTGLNGNMNPPGSFGYNADYIGTELGGQSIIDKVLDRLHLEDPTLSDMNDPSTLIMPAQEIPSFSSSQVQAANGSFRTLQICPEDENLDGWLPSPSTSGSLGSSSGTPIIGIRGGRPGSFAQGHSHGTSSSLTAPAASYSSFPDMGLVGHMSGASRNRVSGQAQDAQGRNVLQYGSRGSHGFHSASSSLSGYQQLLSQSLRQSPQRPNGLQLSFEKSAASPSTTPVSSPLSSPKLSTFSGNSLSSVYTAPHSPRTYFYRADSGLRRAESNASLASISTINSCPGDGVSNDKVDENANAMSLDQKPNGGSSNSAGSTETIPTKTANAAGGKYGVENNQQSSQILHRDEKSVAAVSGKKAKKLWSGCGATEFSQSPEKSCSPQSGGTEGKKTLSQSLDSANPMLKGLVLITPTSKKQSRDSHVSSKGHSNSMAFLFKGMDQHTPEDQQHRTPLPTPPGSFHLENSPFLSSSSSSSFASSSSSRIQTPSVFHMEDPLTPSPYRPSVGDILSSRLAALPKSPTSPPSHSDSILHHRPMKDMGVHKKRSYSAFPKITTDPVSSLDNEWRCVDPNLQQSLLTLPLFLRAGHARSDEDNPFRANVSRHIVAPDELALAIEKEDAEEREQKERQVLRRVTQSRGAEVPVDTEEVFEANDDVDVEVLTRSAVDEPPEGALHDIDGPLSVHASSLHSKDLSPPPVSPLPPVPPALPKRSPRRSAPIVLPPQFMRLSP